jgi:hypothetical protein
MLLLCVTAGGLPAGAQTLEVSGACAQQCGAASRLVREGRPEVQACLIRCNAAQEFDRSTGAPRVQHGPPPPRTGRRQAAQAEARRAAPYHPTPVPPPSMAMAAGRSAAHPPTPTLPAASSVPMPARGMAHPTPATASAASRAAQVAIAAATGSAVAAAAPAATGRWGAAYLAPAPATEFGLTVGVADRLAAHAQAQSACGARGAACRAALEFADRCGAVAQARRTLGLFRTADPRTYSVSYAAAGAGATREAAENVALDECRARERTTSCEIVASACGRP